MLTTSYFANAKNIHKSRELVSISRFSPAWFNPDHCALELAPSKELLLDYKKGGVSEADYEKRYREETLSWLDPNIVNECYKNSTLLCYEKSSDFCHRHILREWLAEHKIESTELLKDVTILIIVDNAFVNTEYLSISLDRLLSNFHKPSIVNFNNNLLINTYIDSNNIESLTLTSVENIDKALVFHSGDTTFEKISEKFHIDPKDIFLFNYKKNTWNSN